MYVVELRACINEREKDLVFAFGADGAILADYLMF